MRQAAIYSPAHSGHASGGYAPQLKAINSEPGCQPADATNGRHEHRIALIASISGGTLNRVNECTRLELASANGQGSCERLRSGSVDCSCDYCEVFWSRLEERLRQR
jgi:hypothetical protein